MSAPSDGRRRLSLLFARLFDDVAFRRALITARDRRVRAAMIREAGYAGYTRADVAGLARHVLDTGTRPGAPADGAWAPGRDETWADAPPAVFAARRRAIVFGALADAAAAGHLPVCRPLPWRLTYAIAGGLKCGTTALDHFLAAHPDICTAAQKETHFFVRDLFFEEPEPAYEWLDFSFAHHRGEHEVGEATPEYLYFPVAARRMHDYNPRLKLIFLLRHPADRAYSQYRMAVARGEETRPFNEALADDRRRDGGLDGVYTAAGFYRRAIEHYVAVFPRQQMLFLTSEDLRSRHRETVESVYRFLGVAPVPAPPSRQLLVGTGPPLPAPERRLLLELYRDETRGLEHYLGWDLSAWRR